MIAMILATLVAISPIHNPPTPTPTEQCTSFETFFFSRFGPASQVSLYEVLFDYRITHITKILKELTNALDDTELVPDAYVVLTLPDDPIAMLIIMNGDCVIRPIYINLKFYEEIKEEKEI